MSRTRDDLKKNMVAMHQDNKRFKFNKDLYTGGVSYVCKTCKKEFKNKTTFYTHERIHKSEKPYQCELREFKSVKKENLTRHVRSVHRNGERFKSNKNLYTGGVSHKCGTCNKEFKKKWNLNRHVRTHTGEKPYQCKLCEHKFSRKEHLTHHVRSVHRNGEHLKSNKDLYTGGVPHKCKTCNKEFTLKSSLNRHVRIHTGEKPYQCKLCEHKFIRKEHLTCHVRSVHRNGERLKSNKNLYTEIVSYKCGMCNNEFKSKAHLYIHERTHINEKPYHYLMVLGYHVDSKHKHKRQHPLARRRDALRKHMVAMHKDVERLKSNKDLYTGGVLYTCGTCDKRFVCKTDWSRHERIHTNEKPYKCDICGHMSRTRDDLKKNMVAMHQDNKRFKFNKDLYTGGVSYVCKTCKKEFKNKTTFYTHERIHKSEKPYQCELREFKSVKKENLTRHVRSVHRNGERFKSNKNLYTGGVSHKCGTCNKEFKKKWNLNRHVRTHTGEKPYQCKLCEHKFSRKEHLTHHVRSVHRNGEHLKSNKDLYTGGVPHKCKTCNKEFTIKSSLNRHVRIHTGEKPYQCKLCEHKFM
ncbi:PREDICTED: zinc finger protein 845-like [Cyphomyrmex costatus]|uniref:zinc finger protein 845-like n=1 Tax=Cyphomyrmex costatus TaxID=456900 RepID=UPI00085224F6|nr:PREDICTED: zinc finger protein 845-like [Cyphomyrmex costatus]